MCLSNIPKMEATLDLCHCFLFANQDAAIVFFLVEPVGTNGRKTLDDVHLI